MVDAAAAAVGSQGPATDEGPGGFWPTPGPEGLVMKVES